MLFQNKHNSQLYGNHQYKFEDEGFLGVLMPEESHPDECTKSTAHKREEQQDAFSHSVRPSFCKPLVPSKGKESDEGDDDQIVF